MVDILIAFPQIQAVKFFKILSNLIHIEMLSLESHFIHLLQIGQQRICTMIYSMAVNPKEPSMIAIISLGMQVGNSRTRIIVHQAIHQSPYLFGIDCIVWVHHLLIVFQRQVLIFVGFMLLTRQNDPTEQEWQNSKYFHETEYLEEGLPLASNQNLSRKGGSYLDDIDTV